MKKTEILKIITQYSIKYNTHLNNKNFIILAKSKNNIIPFNIIFDSTNYLHLTGVVTSLSAQDFFDACLNNKLSLNMFKPKYNDNIMKAKMDALPHLVNIYKLAKNIGDYNNSKPNLYTDKILGNISVSLGLVYPKENKLKKYMQPNSLMSEDSRTLSKKPFLPIVAILSKNITEKYFDTITYKSKNINIDKLHFPKEIKELLTEKALYELKPSLAPQTKIIENLSFGEILPPTNSLEQSQDKAINEIATIKEEPPQKDTITNRLAQSKEKAKEHNQQNKKQQNIDNLEH